METAPIAAVKVQRLVLLALGPWPDPARRNDPIKVGIRRVRISTDVLFIVFERIVVKVQLVLPTIVNFLGDLLVQPFDFRDGASIEQLFKAVCLIGVWMVLYRLWLVVCEGLLSDKRLCFCLGLS